MKCFEFPGSYLFSLPSQRFSIPLLPRILPDKISSLQSDAVLWFMRFSNREKLTVSDKHALSVYPQQRMAKSTSSLTWYCQGKLMGQFRRPVFSYRGYYQSPLLTSFSRSYPFFIIPFFQIAWNLDQSSQKRNNLLRF